VTPTIRPAAFEDAGFIARTVLAAQRGHRPRGWFDVALDWPEPQCLDFIRKVAVTRTISWWHTSQFLIADVEGAPAAALCALPSSGSRAAARQAIAEVATEIGLDEAGLSAIWRRGAYSGTCWVQGDDSHWMIEHVASHPSYRGRGLMQALIEQGLAAGKAAGFERVSISFLIGNAPAERCYTKAGFAFAEEKRNAAFEAITGAPGFRRFERVI
jgi:ribosomal protein S18 acetylase RimI-like enzyme